MRYAGLIKNDFSAGPGVCLTFFAQGCPFHCPGCHNPDSWDFDGGEEFTPKVLDEIVTGLTANGIVRPLCIMGGEPLCDENLFLTALIIRTVKDKLPSTKIYVWTGFLYEDLVARSSSPHLRAVLENTDVLIDGPYKQELRDVTLPMRGSSNQRIIELTK